MKKKATLKPCPFCGSSSLKIDVGNRQEKNPSYVFCKNCVSVGPSANTPFEAVYEWNSREDEPPQVRRLLNIRQVCSCLGLSRATVYRLIQNGNFPKPIHPRGTNSARWTPADVEKYQEQSASELKIIKSGTSSGNFHSNPS